MSKASSSPKRSNSSGTLDKLVRLGLGKKSGRGRRACIIICMLLFILGGVGLALLLRSNELRQAANPGSLPSFNASETSGWELARHGFLLGGQGLLQAVGLGAVVSSEEQKRIRESLQLSGDDDHEVVENLAPPPPAPPRREETPVEDDRPPTIPPTSTDPKVIEKVPLAGFPNFQGELALTDGTCRIHRKETETGIYEEDCMANHGYCSRGSCVCSVAYSGNSCGQGKKHFTSHMRSFFEGRFALSASHVRRMRTAKYVLPSAEGAATGPASFEVPYDKTGKTNRLVWAKLQQSNLASLDPVFSVALLDLLPGKDPLMNSVFKSCAIVGNSGFNLLFPNGRAIDAHSMVIRLFDGPTRPERTNLFSKKGHNRLHQDFRPVVGGRTTFRVLDSSAELLGHRETPDEITLSPVTDKQHFFGHFQFLNSQPEARAYLLDPDFNNYVSENLKSVPSPLAIALFFAIQKCSWVDVYGAHWLPGYGVPELYYAHEGDPEEDSQYSTPNEIKLLEALARDGVVSLAHPCAAGCEAESGVPCVHCPAGSTCACGKRNPIPVALPGFCHLPGNFTCFFKCPSEETCPGGPDSSKCPLGLTLPATCALKGLALAVTPQWAKAGGMREWDRKWELTRKAVRRARKILKRKQRM